MGMKEWWDGPRQEAISRTVTVGGTLLSLSALALGLALPNDMSFLISVTAALTLIGPGLVFSNILVGRWQRRRIEQQALPWLLSACSLLAQSFETCREISAAAGAGQKLPPTPDKCDLGALAASASSFPDSFAEVLATPQSLPKYVRLDRNDLTLTHFGLVAQMLSQASSLVPLAASLQIATVSGAWAESVGVTTVDLHREDGRGVLNRKIGYSQIIDTAKSAELSPSLVTHFDTQSLVELAVNQLIRTHRLLNFIVADLPSNVANSLGTFDLPKLERADHS